MVVSGGNLNVAGTVTSDVTVFSGGLETVAAGGVVSGSGVAGTTLSGGEVNVLSGGQLAFATVSSGGELNVSKGGSAADIVVSSGGGLNVAGTVTGNVTVLSGGRETISRRRPGERRGRFGHVGCGRRTGCAERWYRGFCLGVAQRHAERLRWRQGA